MSISLLLVVYKLFSLVSYIISDILDSKPSEGNKVPLKVASQVLIKSSSIMWGKCIGVECGLTTG